MEGDTEGRQRWLVADFKVQVVDANNRFSLIAERQNQQLLDLVGFFGLIGCVIGNIALYGGIPAEYSWFILLELPEFAVIYTRHERFKEKLLRKEFQYWYLLGLNMVALTCGFFYVRDIRVIVPSFGFISLFVNGYAQDTLPHSFEKRKEAFAVFWILAFVLSLLQIPFVLFDWYPDVHNVTIKVGAKEFQIVRVMVENLFQISSFSILMLYRVLLGTNQGILTIIHAPLKITQSVEDWEQKYSRRRATLMETIQLASTLTSLPSKSTLRSNKIAPLGPASKSQDQEKSNRFSVLVAVHEPLWIADDSIADRMKMPTWNHSKAVTRFAFYAWIVTVLSSLPIITGHLNEWWSLLHLPAAMLVSNSLLKANSTLAAEILKCFEARLILSALVLMMTGFALSVRDARCCMIPAAFLNFLYILFLDAQSERKRMSVVSRVLAWTNLVWVLVLLFGLYMGWAYDFHDSKVQIGVFSTSVQRRTLEAPMLILAPFLAKAGFMCQFRPHNFAILFSNVQEVAISEWEEDHK